MRIALIDNASLTAVQRLQGDIEVENLYALDGDIAAQEGLVRSILFYDTIYCIDDYKPEFRDERRARFKFISFLSPGEALYDEYLVSARHLIADTMFRVHGGQIADQDFAEFFAQLDVHHAFTWDMSSSDFFLRIKMLAGTGEDIDKYSASTQALYEQKLDRDRTGTSDTRLRASFQLTNGKDVSREFKHGRDKYSISSQLWAFTASLNWLALRSAFYTVIGSHNGIEVMQHPIRSAFITTLAHRKLGLDDNFYSTLVGALAENASAVVREVSRPGDTYGGRSTPADIFCLSCARRRW